MNICSHSVAVAEVNNQLNDFLGINKRRKSPNLTRLVSTSAPRGRGKKGSVASSSRSRKLSEPVTRVEMNINSGPITQSSSLMPNVLGLQSTFYGSNIFHPVAGYPSPYQYGYPSYNYEQSLYPCPLPSPTAQLSPFVLHFITGNITVCFGCKNKYKKSLQPPEDLCIKHQDWRQFTPPNSDTPQHKDGNVYYHCKPECIWICHPCLKLDSIEVPESIREKLTTVHKQYLGSVFGLEL